MLASIKFEVQERQTGNPIPASQIRVTGPGISTYVIAGQTDGNGSLIIHADDLHLQLGVTYHWTPYKYNQELGNGFAFKILNPIGLNTFNAEVEVPTVTEELISCVFTVKDKNNTPMEGVKVCNFGVLGTTNDDGVCAVDLNKNNNFDIVLKFENMYSVIQHITVPGTGPYNVPPITMYAFGDADAPDTSAKLLSLLIYAEMTDTTEE